MTKRLNDPTDSSAPRLPHGRALEWIDALPQLQMLYGICSEPTCQWPIAGWCADSDCRAKLCLDHLAEHRNRHAHREARER